MSDISALKAFTDHQLHEELLRRSEADPVDEDRPYCQDCKNFNPYAGRKIEPPKDFNPCTKKHAMEFEMPTDFNFESGGFYRPGCLDFQGVLS